MEKITANEFRQRMAKRHDKGYRNANDLTNRIVDYLNLSGFAVWRNNTGVVFDVRAAAKKILQMINALLISRKQPGLKQVEGVLRKSFRKGSGEPGESDIFGIEKATGKFVAIEVKFGKDDIKPDQKIFLRRISKNGGHAIVARSLSDVIDYFERQNYIKGD